MPFVLIFMGAVLVAAAVRGTQGQLFTLIRGDFSGPNNFIYWVVSILMVGALGYVPKLKPISDGFLVLIIVVLFLRRGTGFFDQFTRQIQGTETYKNFGTGIGVGTSGGVVRTGGTAIGISGGRIGVGGIGVSTPPILVNL